MRRVKHHSLEGLLALLLFGVFAVCILSVLLTGADAYQRLTERDQTSYDRRTAAQYLSTRLRQGDVAGQVALGDFDGPTADGGDTLFLYEYIDGEVYLTRVYCHDGWLRELFTAADADMVPSDGEKVLEAQTASFAWTAEGLLTAALTGGDGHTEQVTLTLRSGEGAAS